MAWSTIRKATSDDKRRLSDAAKRFCERHNIREPFDDDFVMAVEYETADNPRLAGLWRKAVRRALRCQADGIAYGYVGFSVQ